MNSLSDDIFLKFREKLSENDFNESEIDQLVFALGKESKSIEKVLENICGDADEIN